MANFWRVLEFAKFAGEWPLLSFNTLKVQNEQGMKWFLVELRNDRSVKRELTEREMFDKAL